MFSWESSLICFCDPDFDANRHAFLYCHLFSNYRDTLLTTVNVIDISLTNTNYLNLTDILLIINATKMYVDQQIWKKAF